MKRIINYVVVENIDHFTIADFDPKFIKRFWNSIDKNGPIPKEWPELGPCWVWTKTLTKEDGYGKLFMLGKYRPAHRVSWIIHNGPIPAGEGYHGICVLHKCDHKKCSNPDHLFLGTHFDNMQDMMSKGRRITPAPRKKDTYKYGDENYWRINAHLRPRGSAVGTSKLTEAQVAEIKIAVAGGEYYKTVAARYSVTSSNIRNIIKGLSWRHVIVEGLPDYPPQALNVRAHRES